jgi:hypothetical protein
LKLKNNDKILFFDSSYDFILIEHKGGIWKEILLEMDFLIIILPDKFFMVMEVDSTEPVANAMDESIPIQSYDL